MPISDHDSVDKGFVGNFAGRFLFEPVPGDHIRLYLLFDAFTMLPEAPLPPGCGWRVATRSIEPLAVQRKQQWQFHAGASVLQPGHGSERVVLLLRLDSDFDSTVLRRSEVSSVHLLAEELILVLARRFASMELAAIHLESYDEWA